MFKERGLQLRLVIMLLAGLLFVGQVGHGVQEDSVRTVTILYTNDEHGWMETQDTSGGAAELLGLWKALPEFGQSTLILSGGDMWTGPAISTWHDGKSMVEVMNAMGYAAAAVGNHEYDFGFEALEERFNESAFPFLAANLPEGTLDFLPDFIIEEVNGVQVGIIGLTRTGLIELESNPDTLRRITPQVREAGAELVIVISHFCLEELGPLRFVAAELEIAMLGGGHCNQLEAAVRGGDVAVISGGSQMSSYARVDITFDTMFDEVVEMTTSVHFNTGGEPDEAVADIISGWRALTDEALGEVIGYVNRDIDQRSAALFNLFNDAWLWAFPEADAALNNRGGFRQDIPSGEITRETILGVFPFDNIIIEVKMTGAELIQNIQCCNPSVAGVNVRGGITLADGTPIDPDAIYTVLVNSFMFEVDDNYTFRPESGRNTQVPYREPLINYLIELNTTPENPLDPFLDHLPR